jgi:secondary thiamine-phosphate synthase enzyme
MWFQKSVQLKAKARGFHLITDELLRELPELHQVECGLFNLFIQHTSASLAINENADPTVRQDLESFFNRCVPEKEPYYRHDYEGDDDMPAHIKSCILGASLMIPVTAGALNLGTWQGIYLCEHRNHGGSRTVIATIQGYSKT